MIFPVSAHNVAKRGSFLPMSFSFPKPDESCFTANYAPSEPTILLPNNFVVANDLDSIVSSLEAYLSKNSDSNKASTGSSWSGTWVDTYRVCLYKSKTITGQHVVEVQRTGGDGFVFGNFYNNLKTTLRWYDKSEYDFNSRLGWDRLVPIFWCESLGWSESKEHVFRLSWMDFHWGQQTTHET